MLCWLINIQDKETNAVDACVCSKVFQTCPNCFGFERRSKVQVVFWDPKWLLPSMTRRTQLANCRMFVINCVTKLLLIAGLAV